MADEAVPSAPPTNGAGASPEPVAASPAAAPAPVPAVEAAPVAAPAPAAPAAEPAPSETPTLLETIKPEPAKPAEPEKPAAEAKPEDKPAEPKPADKPVEAKPTDAPKPDAPAEPAKLDPVAYEYALPDTIKMDDAFKGEFHAALDALRADPTKGAQGLIDLHNKAMTNFADETLRNQISTFNTTRKGWQTDVMADPELGGAGYETTMGAVARMRDLLVPESRRAAFNDFLRITGAGDHPEFLRLLHNAARFYDEAPMPPPGAKPPPNIGKPQGRGLRGLYKSNQGRQQ